MSHSTHEGAGVPLQSDALLGDEERQLRTVVTAFAEASLALAVAVEARDGPAFAGSFEVYLQARKRLAATFSAMTRLARSLLLGVAVARTRWVVRRSLRRVQRNMTRSLRALVTR